MREGRRNREEGKREEEGSERKKEPYRIGRILLLIVCYYRVLYTT